MNLTFKYPVVVNDKVFYVKELSFYSYKNFIKSLLVKDVKSLSLVFTNLLKDICDGDIEELDNLEKFLLLLKIRATTVGESIEITLSDKKVSVSVNKIFSSLNKKTPNYIYEIDGSVYEFSLPKSFIPHSNVFSLAIDCLQSINGTYINSNVKENIQDNLPALPLSEICLGISKNFESITAEVPYIQLTLSPFDSSFIEFITSIFSYDLNSFYNLEYVLRKSINLHSQDFETLSMQECEILLKNYKEELVEAEKSSKQKEGIDIQN